MPPRFWGSLTGFMAGPAAVEVLAAQVGAHAPSLYRLLRALAGVGVFHRA